MGVNVIDPKFAVICDACGKPIDDVDSPTIGHRYCLDDAGRITVNVYEKVVPGSSH